MSEGFHEQKKTEKKKEDTQQPAKDGQVGTKGGAATDFMPLLHAVLDFLSDLKSKLRVDVLQVYVTLAGGDPCDLAINYGKAWAAVGNIMPHLERIFVIKNRDVQVNCDFTGDKTRVYARLDLTVTVARLLSLGLRYGTKVIREYLQIVKIKKGGALQ